MHALNFATLGIKFVGIFFSREASMKSEQREKKNENRILVILMNFGCNFTHFDHYHVSKNGGCISWRKNILCKASVITPPREKRKQCFDLGSRAAQLLAPAAHAERGHGVHVVRRRLLHGPDGMLAVSRPGPPKTACL